MAEEVGLVITAGRHLAVEHRVAAHGRPSNLQLVFASPATRMVCSGRDRNDKAVALITVGYPVAFCVRAKRVLLDP